jgi:hypothetical protein
MQSLEWTGATLLDAFHEFVEKLTLSTAYG